MKKQDFLPLPMMALIVTILTFGTTSCGQKNASSLIDYSSSPSSSANCEYPITEGDSSASSSQMTKSIIALGLFSKKYYPTWLTTVSQTSLLHTIDLVQSTGVDLYTATPHHQDGRSCLNFDSLPFVDGMTSSASVAIQNEWNQANQNNGAQSGTVMGIYLNQPEKNISPTIILREDGHRWTLVHEFMHHNFTSASINEDHFNELNLTQSLDENVDAITQADQLSELTFEQGQQKYQTLIPLIAQHLDLLREFLNHYTLEEIAIESLLRKQYEQNQLKFVPKIGYENAMYYIHASAAKARLRFSKVYDAYQSIMEQGSHFAVSADILEKGRRSGRAMMNLIQELRSIETLNDPDTKSLQVKKIKIESQLKEPCPHAQGAEKNLNRWDEALQSIYYKH